MNIYVLDKKFRSVYAVDSYTSFIWTDRYREYGDFEIVCAPFDGWSEIFVQDYYIYSSESVHLMIIEKITIEADMENGNTLTISGRSLESILDRRIVWSQTTVSGTIDACVKKLLNENLISPSNNSRQISNFIYSTSSSSIATTEKIEAQYTGDCLYDIVVDICADYGLGFKVTLNDSNQMVFQLYSGVDRSYSQQTVTWVVFSSNFNNLLNSNYLESRMALKNVALIGGEGEGSERKYATIGSVSGLERRELFVDARDISSNEGQDDEIDAVEYEAQLEQRGYEKLTENVEVISFEGEIDTDIMFAYNKDFYDGDIVQVLDDYGHSQALRIVEVVRSEDTSGSTICPTFEIV